MDSSDSQKSERTWTEEEKIRRREIYKKWYYKNHEANKKKIANYSSNWTKHLDAKLNGA